jgi:predicted NUDIX family NTP pyrophosphohydrolase
VPRISAGLLLYRRTHGAVEVLLAHPGGPFWTRKDLGAWTIPKGEPNKGEELLDAARREFEEEIGVAVDGQFVALAPVRQKGGKLVHAWILESDLDTLRLSSNTFTREWPPRSGKVAEYPEVDRIEWFNLATAWRKINEAQRGFLEQLAERLGGGRREGDE